MTFAFMYLLCTLWGCHIKRELEFFIYCVKQFIYVLLWQPIGLHAQHFADLLYDKNRGERNHHNDPKPKTANNSIKANQNRNEFYGAGIKMIKKERKPNGRIINHDLNRMDIKIKK